MIKGKQSDKLPISLAALIAVLTHALVLFPPLFEDSAPDLNMVGQADQKSLNKIYLQFVAPHNKQSQSARAIEEAKPTHQQKNPLKGAGEKPSQPAQYVSPNLIKNYLPQSMANSALADANANFALEIPEGREQDELNEIELVIYSFNKRVAEQFVGALINTLYEHERVHPLQSIPVDARPDKVRLKATYDQNGNVIRIKTMIPASAKLHSEYFHKAIQSIERIPNIPKILLNHQSQYSIQYELNLNTRR